MKLLINASNLYVGGGLQVALSFINELKLLKKNNEYHIFLSQKIAKQTKPSIFPENFHFYRIEKSPSSLLTRNAIVAKLDRLEEQIKPDVVFSVFGPSYWKPKSRHIMGFAIPWVLQNDSIAYDELSLIKRFKMRLWVRYVSYYVKRDATHYIIETSDGKERMSNTLGIAAEKISVVGNSYSSIYDDPGYLAKQNLYFIDLPVKEVDEFRLVLISHNYPHKNLKIINHVLSFLDAYNIRIVLTIDDKSYATLFPTNERRILNIGPVNQKSCPSLYSQCDAMFLPTLLEVFSVSYLEAMKMEKPILTSNYSFAIDICQDAALYFDPLDPIDIAMRIKQLIDNSELQRELVDRGRKRVREFETAKSRAEKYLALCETVVNYEQ